MTINLKFIVLSSEASSDDMVGDVLTSSQKFKGY